MKVTLLKFFEQFWVKVTSLLTLVASIYGIAVDTDNSLLDYIFYFLGSGSFVSVATGLFANDLESIKRQDDDDRKTYEEIIKKLPHDQNFIYWTNEFDFSARSFSATYIEGILILADSLPKVETIFFHHKKLNQQYQEFLRTLSEFAYTISGYTTRNGDRIQGVYRAEENPPYETTPEDEQLWRERVDAINNTASDLYNAYTKLIVDCRKALKCQ